MKVPTTKGVTMMTLKEIVAQLELCGYTCQAGPLENNVAFIELVKRAEAEDAE